MQMGVAGFSYQGDVFLAKGLDAPGAPGRSRVLEHEAVHARQSRQRGPVASRGAIEKQADRPGDSSRLLSADPDRVYGWLWIPAIIAFGYITTRSNTANAPGPNDKTYPSLTTADYFKMSGEAALLAGGGALVRSIRAAGYSMVAAWGGSGAVGSVGFRAISDIHAGQFSGPGAYVVDGLTGAVVGIVMGGTFHAIGKMPSMANRWFFRGAENDPSWAKMSFKDKWLYEIGQKTLPKGQWEPLTDMSPVERGRHIVDQQGWMRGLFPRSGGFMVPGEGGTLSTGPTPMFRQWGLPAVSGAAGRHGLYPDWENMWSQSDAKQDDGNGPSSDLMLPLLDPAQAPANDGLVPLPIGSGSDPSMHAVPPGWDTIIVVPEGKEMEYLIKTGKVGDFNPPKLPEGQAYG